MTEDPMDPSVMDPEPPEPQPEPEPEDDPTKAEEDQPFDHFGVEHMHLKPDYADAIGVERVVLAVPVRKPKSQEWVKVHPEHQAEVLVIEDQNDREIYYLSPLLKDALGGEAVATTLFLTTSRQHTIFLWPCRVINPDAKPNIWHVSRRDAAMKARDIWCRVQANTEAGYYDCEVSHAIEAEPKWPDLPMNEVMRLAFQKSIIDTIDHPLVRQLQGLE